MRRLALAAALALAGGTAQAADCVGQNLIAALPAETRAQIDAAVTAVPHHQGILWRATRGEARITLVGTYHFDDPRHRAMLDRIGPDLRAAAVLLVEAGPEEEARLTKALATDPALMIDPTGPTLPERLAPEEWARLSAALSERGIPAIIASKMRPWYVSMMLAVSPCMLKAMVDAGGETGGLDRQLTAAAAAAGVPVRALEPWDTVFSLFAGMTPAEEIDMIRVTLPAAAHADDYAVTLADAYFAEDVWRIWEFGRFDAYDSSGLDRAEVDAQMRFAQGKLMDGRNAAWIAPLESEAETAARDGKGVVAGFGALHLPGAGGVLALLEARGWQVERLAVR